MIFVKGIGLCRDVDSFLGDLAALAEIELTQVSSQPLDLKKQLRRSGAFATAGAYAAANALDNQGFSSERLEKTGIIVTSSIGDQNTTSDFIDEMIDYGAGQGSPIKFAHSSHNTAASYIAKLFSIHGPAITAINLEETFANGLRLATCWLADKTCDDILLLQIESHSHLSRVLASSEYSDEQKAFPASTSSRKAPCEAACLLLSRDGETSWQLPSLSCDAVSANFAARLDSRLIEPIKMITAILTQGY